MKSFTLTLILFLSISFPSGAQEIPESTFSHDIGFNTSFILEGILSSSTTPFAMMYKKYTAENRANRFGADLSLSLNKLSGSSSSSYYDKYSRANVRLLIGKEIQRPITTKWIWFYGGDVEPFYNFYHVKGYQNDELSTVSETSEVGVNLRPFLAIRYNINSRLYLSTEASVNLSYSFQRQLVEYPMMGTPGRDTESHGLSFYAGSAHGIFLFYRF